MAGKIIFAGNYFGGKFILAGILFWREIYFWEFILAGNLFLGIYFGGKFILAGNLFGREIYFGGKSIFAGKYFGGLVLIRLYNIFHVINDGIT